MFNISKQFITKSEIREDSTICFYFIYLIQERERGGEQHSEGLHNLQSSSTVIPLMN